MNESDSRGANALENIGAISIFLGVFAVVAVLPAWLQIGQWVPVLTWHLSIASALTVAGVVLFDIGYRWNRRCRNRWAKARDDADQL